MLKKTITYTDYNDNVRTEDFYFHLSKAEMLKLDGLNGDPELERTIQNLGKQDDVDDEESKKRIVAMLRRLLPMIENIVQKAYGVKSEDGRRFIKNDELLEEFMSTEAYSDLIMELITSDEAASNFISGALPKDMADAVSEKMNEKRSELTVVD